MNERSMPKHLQDVLEKIAQQPQRQDSTMDQLRDLLVFANRLGLYDAADYLKSVVMSPSAH